MMTFVSALLIAILAVFIFILLLVLLYLGPILTEAKLALRNARMISDRVTNRVAQVDSIIEKFSGVIAGFQSASAIAQFVSKFIKKSKKGE
jgi:predicted PurR-regulated permease PerM